MKRSKALKLREAILLSSKHLLDEVALEVPELFNTWAAGKAVSIGDVVRYGEHLYRCIQAHTTQTDWPPDITPALWNKISPPDIIPEWVQPLGSHDAYQIGDKVTHNEKTWESTIDDNIWEPSVYGWTEI